MASHALSRIGVAEAPAEEPDPLRFPTDRHPRWRLVMFDRRWPWRTTRGQVLRDAIAAKLARHDLDDKVVYLEGFVHIQRDPPEFPWLRRR